MITTPGILCKCSQEPLMADDEKSCDISETCYNEFQIDIFFSRHPSF